MSKALCLAAILASAAVSGASVRMFVTGSNQPYGLSTNTSNGQTNALVPTFATCLPNGHFLNAYDYYYHKLAAAPPIDAPSGTGLDPVLIDRTAGEFGYMWFQFIGEPGGSLVNGMQIMVINEATGLSATGAFCYYKQDNRNSFSSNASRRWDGTSTPPNHPEWTKNPQTFIVVATSGGGIINEAAQAPAGNNWNLFTWQAGTVKGGVRTGVSLVGALDLAEGLYSIRTPLLSYASGPYPSPDSVGYFRVIPEPASVLLLCLVGVLIRRR
jgi:hypothetical protein